MIIFVLGYLYLFTMFYYYISHIVYEIIIRIGAHKSRIFYSIGLITN